MHHLIYRQHFNIISSQRSHWFILCRLLYYIYYFISKWFWHLIKLNEITDTGTEGPKSWYREGIVISWGIHDIVREHQIEPRTPPTDRVCKWSSSTRIGETSSGKIATQRPNAPHRIRIWPATTTLPPATHTHTHSHSHSHSHTPHCLRDRTASTAVRRPSRENPVP